MGAYVTGRALENFMPESTKEVVVKTEAIKETSTSSPLVKPTLSESQKSIKLPEEFTHVEIKHIHGQPETVTRKQYENLIKKFGVHSYIVLGYK